jgi:hypothetical protein
MRRFKRLLLNWSQDSGNMDNDRYIWCRKCDVIHRVTSFDQAPLYGFAHGEVQETAANDWRDFMARHAGHKLEPMMATGNDYYPDGSAIDPMSVRYVEVTNGSGTLLLRRSRSSIEDPFIYNVVNGRLIRSGVSLDVQADAIRKEMKLHFSWAPSAPLEDDKIDHFVRLFGEVVSAMDPNRARESEYSYTDDNMTYCELDAATIDTLMAKCGRYFHPIELASIRRFVETHRQGDDVMALVKRRRVTVEQKGPIVSHPFDEKASSSR